MIVPWNHPLRVVEKIAFLDHLSDGRAILGLGRGLSRVEYEHFGIEMNSARDRFDEASRMIIEGLEKGFIEGDGPVLPAGPHRDPAAAAARLPRPLLLRGHLAGVGAAGGEARRAADGVLADTLGDVQGRRARGLSQGVGASTRRARRRRR